MTIPIIERLRALYYAAAYRALARLRAVEVNDV